jgi:DNA polymerase sigma
MLPPELRSAGANQTWNALKNQWRFPFAILADTSPCTSRRSISKIPRPSEKPWSRRYVHSEAKYASRYLRLEPHVFPESLPDTLEAHRTANRESLVHKQWGEFAYPPRQRTSRPELESSPKSKLTDEVRDETQIDLEDDTTPSDRKLVRRLLNAGSTVLDYAASSQSPKQEWEIQKGSTLPKTLRQPWLAYIDTSRSGSLDVYEHLTAEILGFERYVTPTGTEQAAAERAISDVRGTIASLDRTIKTTVIGSRATGLTMPLSDIDINIEVPEPLVRGPAHRKDTRYALLIFLASVKNKLKKKGGPKPLFRDSIVIRAKVPLIQLRHEQTGLVCQLQSTTDCFGSMELVKDYMHEFPTLKPLFLVLRQLLKMRGLGTPQSFGVGSYPLIMMIVAALKLSGSHYDRRDTGRHLLHFLDFYSEMDFRTKGISVNPPEFFRKRGHHETLPNPKIQKSPLEDEGIDTQANRVPIEAVTVAKRAICYIEKERPYLMCLQDPNNPSNDLGSKALAIKHVQATFIHIRRLMLSAMERYEQARRGDPTTFSLLSPCVEGNYKSFEEQRKALHRCGEGFAARPKVLRAQ